MSSKWVPTRRCRAVVVRRWFRKPLVGLEVEFEDVSYYDNGDRPKKWERADLRDLTEAKGIDPRVNSGPIRYRAHYAGLFRDLWLVMQLGDEGGMWQDAMVEDLGNFSQITPGKA